MLAIALKNRQQGRLTVRPSVVDADGQRFLNTDGTSLDPLQIPISWSRDSQQAADPEASGDVAYLEGVEENGQKLVVRSGLNGTATFTATIGPYPDGSSRTFGVNVAIGHSETGDPTSDVAIENEPETPVV